MIYLNVLYIEFIPIVVERFKGRVNLPGPLSALNNFTETLLSIADAILGKIMFLFIIAGIVCFAGALIMMLTTRPTSTSSSTRRGTRRRLANEAA